MRTPPTREPEMNTGEAQLALRADRSTVALAREVITAELGRRGWSKTDAVPVTIAVTEAVANAVEHGSAPHALIFVAFRISSNSAEVQVRDGGPACGGKRDWRRPARMPPPMAPRGRGRAMMRTLADRTTVRRHGDGTLVTLVFRRASMADG